MNRNIAKATFSALGGLLICGTRLSTAGAAQVDAIWLGGSGNWNVSENWSGGIVPNNSGNTFNVFIDDGNAVSSVVTLNMSATIDNLTIDASDLLLLDNGWTLRLVSGVGAGTIVNSGTIALNSTGSYTYLYLSGGDVTLAGGGVLNMSDYSVNRVRGSAGTERLINVDNTIQGAGQICANMMSLTNQGTIIANLSNTLAIDPNGDGFINEAALQATGAGGLALATGPFTTSGTVSIDSGSQLSRSGDYAQTSGTTTVDGLLSATGIVDIQGGTLMGNGTVSADVTTTGTVGPGGSTGTLTIDGAYTQPAGGNLSIEISGPTPGAEYDVLSVSGTA